jgi:peroxiredoxin
MIPDQPKNSSSAPRWLLIAFGLAALALAASLLYWGYGRLRDEPEEALQSIPAFSGTAESGLGSLSLDTENLPQIGDPAPDFELLNMSGETVRLSDYLGRPVILNFWATWCAPCRLEMPELQRAQAEFGDEGPAVLAINQEESAERVGEFLDEVGLTLPTLLDSDAAVGKTYGAFFLPTTVIVDQDGHVAAIHRGMISRDELDEYLGRSAPTEGS